MNAGGLGLEVLRNAAKLLRERPACWCPSPGNIGHLDKDGNIRFHRMWPDNGDVLASVDNMLGSRSVESIKTAIYDGTLQGSIDQILRAFCIVLDADQEESLMQEVQRRLFEAHRLDDEFVVSIAGCEVYFATTVDALQFIEKPLH